MTLIWKDQQDSRVKLMCLLLQLFSLSQIDLPSENQDQDSNSRQFCQT